MRTLSPPGLSNKKEKQQKENEDKGESSANNIKLAWDNDCDTCYDSRLNFTIPGYSFDHDYSVVQVYRPSDWYADKGWVYQNKWTCHFYFDGMKNGPAGAAHLCNDDFGIPDMGSEDEMKQALSRLTPEDFARALAAHGYQPDRK